MVSELQKRREKRRFAKLGKIPGAIKEEIKENRGMVAGEGGGDFYPLRSVTGFVFIFPLN